MPDPILDTIAGITDIATSLFNTGYGVYQDNRNFDFTKSRDERDFNYQKDLQQQIFNREDNAVQRRMADLEKAGLNPNLAAGSAAGAGSVVSRSNAPSAGGHNVDNVGSLVETLAAVQQLHQQREQTDMLIQQKKNAEKEFEILENQASYWDWKKKNEHLDYEFGFFDYQNIRQENLLANGWTPDFERMNEDLKAYYAGDSSRSPYDQYGNPLWFKPPVDSTYMPWVRDFNRNYDMSESQYKWLKNKFEFEDTHQFLEILKGITGAATGLSNIGFGLSSALGYGRGRFRRR